MLNLVTSKFKKMTTIYHNPRCGKSRETLQILEEAGETIEVVKYLENPLDVEVIKQLVELLKIEPIELIRKNETIWKEKFKGKVLTDSQIIQAINAFPILMERPIVVKGTKAAIGRPPENVLKIL